MTVAKHKLVLVCGWLMAVLGAVWMGQSFSVGTQFIGIADDLEQTVRFGAAVEIVSISFVTGEKVRYGETVMQVRQPSLEAEIGLVTEQIAGLRFSAREASSTLQAQIVATEQDLRAQLAVLDTKIRNLESRRASTQILLSNPQAQTSPSPIRQELNSLADQKRALQRAARARVSNLNEQLVVGTRPIDADIAERSTQLVELERRRRNLVVTAGFQGRVGSIMFKPGDTVPPYQPILTIHGSNPKFVKGYIHESVLNELTMNAKVLVKPVSSSRPVEYTGVVESLGARIVEYPVRLKVNPMTPAWGREVVIRLPNKHDLLLGEKVSVELARPEGVFGSIRQAFSEVPRKSVREVFGG